MRPLADSSGGALERLELRRPGQGRLIVPDDHRVHPGPKTRAFATDDNNPDRRTEGV